MNGRWLAVGSACLVLVLASESRADFLSLEKSSSLARTITPSTSPTGATVSYGPSSGVVSTNPRTGASQAELDKFDLSGLAGSRILSATLSFSVYLAVPTASNAVNLSVVGRGASSTTVTADDFASNNPVVSSNTTALVPITTTATLVSLYQTAALQALIDGGFSSIAYLFSVTNSGAISFTSPNPNRTSPILSVTYQASGGAVPEPSSLVLSLVGGLTGLAGWKLRRR